MPALENARASARAAVCRNTLRQQFFGFEFYAGDTNGFIPKTWHWHDEDLAPRGYFGGGKLFGPNITAGTYNFTRTRYPVFQCPGEKARVIPTGDPSYNGRATTNYDNEFTCNSYAINWSIGQGSYWNQRRGWNKKKNTPASQATFVVDAGNLGYGWVFNYFEWNIDGASQPYNWYNQGFFHPSNTSNMLYMDGHVMPVQHYSKTGKALFVWIFANGDYSSF